jgi:hypothetical protein
MIGQYMHNSLRGALLAAVAFWAVPSAAADVGVSVTVGEPGFYGRLDIGDFPRPRLIYAEPLLVRPMPVPPPPIYMRVPPGQAKKWDRYCARYRACGRPVYFVEDRWYQDEYVPRYRERHGHGPRDEDRGRGRRDDDHGYDRGDGRDHGHGDHDHEGHGNGNGHH